METLTIKQKKSKLSPALPHKILINNVFVGIMQSDSIDIQIPKGEYKITIQSMIPILSASQWVNIQPGVRNVFTFHDREKWWDLLLAIDMLFWIAELFFTLPKPWDLVYEIFTNGYFVVWLIYEWSIRKKYFKIEFAAFINKKSSTV